MRYGSVCAGIEAASVAWHPLGWEPAWFSEIEPYCNAVLEKNFPGVPNIGDITKVDWDGIERPDMLVGGFPCQDISWAGKGKGIQEGTRSGLWHEYARAIRHLRPELILIENVPALTHRGLDTVLCSLAEIWYDADWFTLSAAEVGAMHKRERLFGIAYPNRERCGGRNEIQGREEHAGETKGRTVKPERKVDAPYYYYYGLQGGSKKEVHQFPEFSWCKDIRRIEDLRGRSDIPEPLIRGSASRVSRRMDNYIRTERTKAIGNAVCPPVAQQIGEWILESISCSQAVKA